MSQNENNIEQDNINNLPIKFENVLSSKDINNTSRFLTLVNGQALVDLFKNGRLIYNPNIQRGLELKLKSKKTEDAEAVYEEVPIKKNRKIKKIFQDLDKGVFYDVDKKLKISEYSIAYDNFTFYGYVALACYMYNQNSDYKIAEYGGFVDDFNIIKQIDFRKESSIWSDLISKKTLNNGDIKYSIANNATSRKKIGTIMIREFKDLKKVKAIMSVEQ